MEFEIKDQQYRTAKLSVFDQLKVSRKLLPVLSGLLGDFHGIKAAADGGDVYKAMETALPKIAESLASMSEEDTNAIIFPCLKVVSRKHLKSWVPVFSEDSLNFDDIELMDMLQLVARVVGDSLGNFFSGLPGKETADPSLQD
ncbi:hypothetical protein BS639_17190 [Rouxiella silvae]|uniref:Bacteriophage protein n=1 Tax=Rouxiella silvae TaxID=1646373 RepID=A0ABX3TY56_9GAMM|nr:hypothetical protein [Rouxiella silvae]ORJ20029.1 hypothetical protein BS639_17190 [Rouxiella silvae]